MNAPAKAPCISCPYRRDVPSGIWDVSEYDKLGAYDRDTAQQPHAVFCCHQQNGRVCAGWVAAHDMDNSLALRLAQAKGLIDAETADRILNYATDIPVFESGARAATHGKRDIRKPRESAKRAITILSRKAKSRVPTDTQP